VAPAAAARQWTNRLGVMVALAAGFGALGGVGGALISSTGAGLSTGPVIVLCVSAIVIISLLLAPNRGVLWRWLAQQQNRRRLQTEQVLSNLYLLASQHTEPTHPHTAAALQVMGATPESVLESLKALSAEGFVQQAPNQQWALTPKGVQRAQQLAGQQKGGLR